MKVLIGEKDGKNIASIDGKTFSQLEYPEVYNFVVRQKEIVKALDNTKEGIIKEYKDESKNKYRRTKHAVAKGQVAIIDRVLEIMG